MTLSECVKRFVLSLRQTSVTTVVNPRFYTTDGVRIVRVTPSAGGLMCVQYVAQARFVLQYCCTLYQGPRRAAGHFARPTVDAHSLTAPDEMVVVLMQVMN